MHSFSVHSFNDCFLNINSITKRVGSDSALNHMLTLYEVAGLIPGLANLLSED